MARPQKNNAEYYSHDANMRNDRRIKAIRSKFGLEGYAIWNMLLEVLTDAENFTIIYDDIEREILAGDFGIDGNLLEEMVDYFQRLKLITRSDTNIFSEELLERMRPLIDKRIREREYAERRKRGKQGMKDIENDAKQEFSTPKTELPTPETPHSKVKESKVKKSKESNKKKEDVQSIKNQFSDSEKITMIWDEWKDYKKNEFKFQFKSSVSEKTSLKKLFKLSGGNTATAETILEQSITGGYKGFFEISESNQKNQKKSNLGYQSKIIPLHGKNGICMLLASERYEILNSLSLEFNEEDYQKMKSIFNTKGKKRLREKLATKKKNEIYEFLISKVSEQSDQFDSQIRKEYFYISENYLKSIAS